MVKKSTAVFDNAQDLQSRILFETMANCAPVLLWMSRLDSLCVFFNTTWLEFRGKTLEQEWGVGWVEGVYFEDVQNCLETYETHFNARTPFEMEYRLCRYDGMYRWILDRGVPYYGTEGEFLGFIGSCVDITDIKQASDLLKKINTELEVRIKARVVELEKSETALKAAKEKAEEATHLKSVFVSTVSHELRTPLTAIKSSLDLLIEDTEEIAPEKKQTLLAVAHRNTERLLRLINDILDVEKMGSGQIHLEKKKQCLFALIQQVFDSNVLFVEKMNAHLKMNNMLMDVYAMVDADRFTQVLENLISNAAKFTRPNTEITISMQRHDGRIRVLVKDCGTGIPPEFATKIFKPFMQAGPSITKALPGTGLGLAISKLIMEQHDGTITYQSSSEGTTFILDLPAC